MPATHLTVRYNTRCPVCDAGIDWQRNKLLQAVRAGTIEFKDINEQPDALAHFGTSLDDIRRRLHATDQAGRLIVGADVAIALWRLTPGGGVACGAVRQSLGAAVHAVLIRPVCRSAVCLEQAERALVSAGLCRATSSSRRPGRGS